MKKKFKAESQRLLDMMINSIYTHKEIFLREIISNASDAIDKMCYLALTDKSVGESRSDYEIIITLDKENRTLTVSDNGIGMDEQELEEHLGTIAFSGSSKFSEQLEKDSKAADTTADDHTGEIDIIALTPHRTIVFVEVQPRRPTRYGLPQEAVHPAKQMNLRRAATQWLTQQTPKVPHIGIRFDVMAVQVHCDEVHMHHIPEAF